MLSWWQAGVAMWGGSVQDSSLPTGIQTHPVSSIVECYWPRHSWPICPPCSPSPSSWLQTVWPKWGRPGHTAQPEFHPTTKIFHEKIEETPLPLTCVSPLMAPATSCPLATSLKTWYIVSIATSCHYLLYVIFASCPCHNWFFHHVHDNFISCLNVRFCSFC